MIEIYGLIAILLLCIISMLYWWYTRDTRIVRINKKEIIEFKDSMALSGLPIIVFYQGETAYSFLLDTGSNVSYVNVKSDFKVTPTGKKSSFMGSSGKDEDCVLVDAVFYKNEIRYTHSLNAADLELAFAELKKHYGVSITGILGNDFFTKYKYCLDFKELVAYRRI